MAEGGGVAVVESGQNIRSVWKEEFYEGMVVKVDHHLNASELYTKNWLMQ